MDEEEMKAQAAYTVGAFMGTMARSECSPAEIAHALFLLIEETLQRRREWIAALNRSKENKDGR